MNFRSRRRAHQESEVSFIPLIDVFLNILIFFLISTSFSSSSMFDIQVPEAKTGKTGNAVEDIRVSVDKSGVIFLDQSAVTKEQLAQKLSTVPNSLRPKKMVALQADKKAMHGAVVTVLDTLRDLGFDKVSLVTQEEK